MSRSRAIWLCAAAAAVVAAIVYALFDPMDSAWMPKCAFHSLTGLKCPGCGSQRMLHALLNGNLADAFAANAMLLLTLPLILSLLLLEVFRTRLPGIYARIHTPATVIAATVLIVLWAVARNIFGW